MSTIDGIDFGWVDLFENSFWLGKEDKFAQYFEEVHGAGSFPKFIADLETTTDGDKSEIWTLRKDLIGPDAIAIAPNRQ